MTYVTWRQTSLTGPERARGNAAPRQLKSPRCLKEAPHHSGDQRYQHLLPPAHYGPLHVQPSRLQPRQGLAGTLLLVLRGSTGSSFKGRGRGGDPQPAEAPPSASEPARESHRRAARRRVAPLGVTTMRIFL